MASIHEYETGVGTRWRVKWTRDGKQYSKSFSTEDDANLHVSEILLKAAKGEPLPLSSRKAMNLAQLTADWDEHEALELADSTHSIYIWAYNNYIRPHLGAVKVQSLTLDPRILDDWRTQLIKDGVSRASFDKIRTVLSAVLARGVKLGIISTNPAHLLKPFKKTSPKRVRGLPPLAIEHMREALLSNPRRRYVIDRRRDALMVSLMGWVGMRPGEVLRIKHDHLTKTRLYIPVTKTGRARYVPLADDIAAEIDRLPVHGEYLFGREIWSESDWRNWQRRIWQPVTREVAAAYEIPSLARARPYDLRHSAINNRLNAGLTPSEIAGISGHLVSTLYTHYTHYIEEAKDSQGVPLVEQRQLARERAKAERAEAERARH